MVKLCFQFICFILSSLIGLGAGAAQEAPEPIDFSRDIQPILSENCYFCHGQDANQRQADLRLDVEEEARAVIEPGIAEDSDLYLRVCSDDPDEQMPPPDSNRSLSAGQKELLRRWLNAGGQWGQHWAYRPMQKKDIATNRAIDFFVEQKLRQSKLKFSPEANNRTLIRRVSLDLTGLPPTLSQIETFLNDTSADAYAKMVDRFLASPAYGERMAWNWLDAARYADTNGYQGDNERTMWPWRDWVVKSFNENMPFDKFSTWQIAGDLLPQATQEQILATGFNRNHPINGEGGRIPEENRIDYVMDMAETTGTLWMGLTFNCCRCHDHKYDQLTQDDYYSLFAFFDQTPIEGGGGNAQTPPVLAVPSKDQLKILNSTEAKISTLETELENRALEIEPQQLDWEKSELEGISPSYWKVLEPRSLVASSATLESLEDHSVLAQGPNENTDVYQFQAVPSINTLRAIRLEALNHPTMTNQGLARSDSSNFVLTDFAVFVEQDGDFSRTPLKLGSATADYEQLPVAHAIDNDPKTGWAVWGQGKDMRQEHEAVFTLAQPIELAKGAKLKFVLKHESVHKKHNLGRFRISITDHDQAGLQTINQALASALKTAPEARSQQQTEIVTKTFHQQDAPSISISKAIASAQEKIKQLNQNVPKVMVMAERKTPRKSFQLNRGSYQQPLNEVTASAPQMLQPLPSNTKPNRLALANWLFDTSNPLTARVSINRLWAQFFGIGIVKTTEDFGVQGEAPSHPELLDWLAAEYRDSGWNTKHMLRLILNSRTYKQQSKTNSQLQELDPANRLLARASRFRMPAWMIRDHALAASGRLVRKVGGKPVNTYQPPGVWEEASFGKKRYQLDQGDALYRRSIYTFWRRIAAPTMFFDNADRMTCSVKSFRTNTPLHALSTLNDTTFIEAARLLATKTLTTHEIDRQRLQLVFQNVLGRLPDTTESSILLTALNRTRNQYGGNLKAAQSLIDIGESPVDQSIDASELASWTSLCLAVINLDEALTRQ